jgi:predicted nuclease of predicted toxin-antitoxin system
MAIRFHLDENVSGAVALALRRRGVDVSTAVEANLIGADDRAHLEFAQAHDRVLVTYDDDFTRIHASGTRTPASAIAIRTSIPSVSSCDCYC